MLAVCVWCVLTWTHGPQHLPRARSAYGKGAVDAAASEAEKEGEEERPTSIGARSVPSEVRVCCWVCWQLVYRRLMPSTLSTECVL